MPSGSSNKNNPQKTVNDYVELIETVCRVEYKRLSTHLVDYNELVNIGAIAIHVLLTSNPGKEFNVTYLSTAIKWAIRNELRRRYKWYTAKQFKDVQAAGEEGATALSINKEKVREAIYETVLSVDEMAEAENPLEIKDQGLNPAENAELTELSKAIKAAIQKVPKRERYVLELRFYENKKMREIAKELGISSSRVSRIVQSGLDKVKRELSKRDMLDEER